MSSILGMTLSRYLDELEESGMNLLVYRGGELVFSSDKKGIVPLIDAIDAIGGEGLGDLVTADRIVGKAAVLLNVYLGAREVHAMLISTGAKELLSDRGIPFVFREETDAIKMRDGVIFCPFERMVQDISDPEVAYAKIRAKLAEF
ncbi:DUF1893 domain-containing protein [Candidatus Bathyarchaeota archaeon]|nr:MAG: DUF1893 domain-containing protein [Candidatus Bathyarchaeota archaeon]